MKYKQFYLYRGEDYYIYNFSINTTSTIIVSQLVEIASYERWIITLIIFHMSSLLALFVFFTTYNMSL